MSRKLATNVPKPSCVDMHNLPLRLAKIPQDFCVGGYKGLNMSYRIEMKLSYSRIFPTQRKNTGLKTKFNLRSQYLDKLIINL